MEAFNVTSEDLWSNSKYELPLEVTFDVTFHEDGDLYTWWAADKSTYESSGLPTIFGTNTDEINSIADQRMVPYTFEYPNGEPFAAVNN
jgi:hypothetical protein